MQERGGLVSAGERRAGQCRREEGWSVRGLF